MARRTPLDDHNDPVWVPVFAALLKNRTPEMNPLMIGVKRSPSSLALASPPSGVAGTMFPKAEYGPPTVTVTVEGTDG